MPDEYTVEFTANVGTGVTATLLTLPDGSLQVTIRATSPTSISAAENTVDQAFGALQAAWLKARS